jgi:hypothetical protein
MAKKRGGGNIQDEPPYDPFPKTGLVKQYEPFVRNHVQRFCNAHPGLNREHVLFRAVEIALQAEKAFRAGVATFPTYLIHRLKELRRLQDEEEKGQSTPIFRTEQDIAAERTAERGEEVTADFDRSNSGERVIIDRQWSISRGGDDPVVARYTDPVWPVISARFRVFIAARATPWVREHMLTYLPILWTTGREPGPTLLGRIQALVDHLKRRQREADLEAENGAPVFLEAERTPVDVRFPRHRSPPRYLAKRNPIVSLDAPVEDEDGNRVTLHDVIGPTIEVDATEQQRATLKEAAEALRPELSHSETRMLDQMLALERRRSGGLTEAARDLGISKGYGSKLWNGLIEKIRRRK